MADMTVQFVAKFDNYQNTYPLVRHDGSAGSTQQYYTALIGDNGTNITFQFYKSVSGNLSTVGTSQNTGIAKLTSGQFVHVKMNAVGTTIQAKVWLDGNSEPGSYQATVTDSSVTAAGYAGVYYHNVSTPGGIDNLQVDSASTLAVGPISFSSVTNTALTASVPAATGGTAGYTYQWYRSTTANFVPQTANLLSGATSIALNDTGLSAGTTYYYRIVATDAAGNVCWSAQNNVTTNATGALTAGSVSSSSVGATTATATVAAATGGTGPYSYQWHRSTANGFTPGGGTIVFGATGLSLNDTGLTPGTGYYYRNVVSDSASATATSSQLAIATYPAFAAGAASLNYVGATSVQLSASLPTGGPGGYGYQWYRSTTFGSNGSALSGKTGLNCIDATAAANTAYYYSLRCSDGTADAAVFTPQVAAVTLASSRKFTVGGIGDSVLGIYIYKRSDDKKAQGASSTFDKLP